jgi:YD repeat-containing protein
MIDAITKPLGRVVEAAQTFVTERKVRLLHVVTTEALRIATIRHIAAEELHSENHCPFLILKAPAMANGAGWGACADELRADMEELRALHEKAGGHGIEIRSMPREARCSSALGRFGVELRAALDRCRSPPSGSTRRIRSADEQHTIELSYDDHGLLSRVVDSGGRVYRFKHDGSGKLREALLPDPHDPGYVSRQFKYECDFRGNLSRVVDALDHSWRFKYSGHLLVREIDRAGSSFFFQYDGRSHEAKCVETWGNGGIFHHVIMYDSLNRKTIVENSLGHVTVYQMDDLGIVASVMDSMQRFTRYEYDPESGQESAVTDPLGRRTQREYDAAGNCVAVTNPDGTVVRVGYERNRPVRVVDECGHVWTRRYDALGRLRAVLDPLGAETPYRCWISPT